MKKLLFIPLLFICTIAYATPSITSYNGGVITCTSAGTKTQAHPLTWDNFEDGVCSASTPTIGTSWNSVNSLVVSTDNNRNNGSSYNAHHNFTDVATAGVRSDNSTLSRKWFVQYWVYLDSNWEWGTGAYGTDTQHLSNIKFLRFWNPGSIDENIYTQFWWGVNDNAYTNVEYVAASGTKNYDTTFSKSLVTKGSWHLFQFEFLDSSDVNQADAEFRMWFDGKRMEERIGFTCKEDYSEAKRIFFAGFYNAWSGGTNDHDNDYYMDDIYVDTTWARVEIGDNSVYGSCTHREIQPPTSWSPTSITVTENKGSFTDGDTAYLFVIDSDGNASSGYPITIGEVQTKSRYSGQLNFTGNGGLG